MFLFCDNNPNVIRIIIFQNIKILKNVLIFYYFQIFISSPLLKLFALIFCKMNANYICIIIKKQMTNQKKKGCNKLYDNTEYL